MSDELKKCPFCGANEQEHEISEDEIHVWITCGNCYATSSRIHTEHHTDPDFAWNTRPIEDALRKDIMELQQERYAKEIETRATIDALQAEIDALKSIGGLEFGVTILAMGKPISYWFDLQSKLEIAVKAIRAFLERFDDLEDTSQDATIYVIEGLRHALAEIEEVTNDLEL